MDAFEAIFYVRFVFSAAVGVLYGVVGSTGLIPFVMFVGASWMFGRVWLTYQG